MLQMPFAEHMVCYSWMQPTGMAKNQSSELGRKDRHHLGWPAEASTILNTQHTVFKLCQNSVKIHLRSSHQSAVKATDCNVVKLTIHWCHRKRQSAKAAAVLHMGTSKLSNVAGHNVKRHLYAQYPTSFTHIAHTRFVQLCQSGCKVL